MRISPSTRRMLITAGIFGVLALFVFGTASFWINWWWFESVGYRSVLATRYIARILAFAALALGGGAIFLGNASFALRRTSRTRQAPAPTRPVQSRPTDRLILPLLLVATLLVAFLAGGAGWRNWETIWLWLQAETFDRSDPVFGRDVGFFVFTLPVLDLLRGTLTWVLFASLVAVTLIYAVRLGVEPRNWRNVPRQMRTHVLGLLGALLLLVGAGFWLASYELAYSTRGVVFGAGYTDANIQRWANNLLALLTVGVAALLLLNAFVNRVRLLLLSVAAWAVLAVVLTVLLPPMIQQTVVEPSEYSRERPFIENNIAETRAAFGLDQVTERDLDGQTVPTAEQLAAHPQTIENIRLWDYRVAIQTYQQAQTFDPYYVFLDVDVDRYLVDGEIVQVLISARELDVDGLPENAQTWTNRRLSYTHGYGVVVGPVSGVSLGSLPTFLVKDIPPDGTGPFLIARPEIYFGEGDPLWVIVGSTQDEFTGLPGEAGIEPIRYDGAAAGSIGVGGTLSQLMAAVYFGDRNILLSGSVTGESRLLFRRNVVERARTIAPFLTYDPDPYLVIADGRLVWVIDAYTTTDRFPHASRYGGVNYIRNSVKVVVDAYDGTTTFYRTDVVDPIADAYAGVYGDLFVPVADAPEAIAAHFRYPELLFSLQTEAFASYHVTDPRFFYDGQERWTIAQEEVGGQILPIEPFYVTLALPEEQANDFTLIRPFTPGGSQARQNMTGWMAARLDGENGPRLVVYKFPRQSLVLGPRQIEARIDQDPEISSQLTLWSQSGSEVIRGNMLVIPIESGLIYVQPLYLRATGTEAAFPELREVIVATSEQVAMRPTLDEALAAVVRPGTSTTGGIEAEPDDGAETTEPPSAESTDLAAQALAAYERAQAALERGDWATYGAELAAMEAILRQLAGEAAAPGATPEATPTGG
jgi:uncharacterized protein